MKAIMCLGVLAMLVGCDASKAELDTTKTTLSDVTKERDALKAQVATLQQQLTLTQGELAKEKATQPSATEKTAKSTMAAKSPAEPAAAPKSKKNHAHKS